MSLHEIHCIFWNIQLQLLPSTDCLCFVCLQLPACLLSCWMTSTSWWASSLSCVEMWIQRVGLSGEVLLTAKLMDSIKESSKITKSVCPLRVTVCRCSQLELRGCALREVCFSIQRDGDPQDTPFSCRVGEIMVRQWEPAVFILLCTACC